ncbi:MAG: hypothetical protein IPM23_20895 [Candidatus Melainabacteria bacterium]|nr:hypothetical protein [Candidatus Melainabacteria bacterium]
MPQRNQIKASLIVATVLAVACTAPGEARPLTGNVAIDRVHVDGSPDGRIIDGQSGSVIQDGPVKLEKQEARMDESPPSEPIKGGVDKQPEWIEGKVFSNDRMYMYSFWQIMPFKKEFKWKIPSGKVTQLRLRRNIVVNWKGPFQPAGSCTVTVEPMGKERFRFHHANPGGPHGYIERVGETSKGFPRYRFWFEEAGG